jgi:hypothetical protein
MHKNKLSKLFKLRSEPFALVSIDAQESLPFTVKSVALLWLNYYVT